MQSLSYFPGSEIWALCPTFFNVKSQLLQFVQRQRSSRTYYTFFQAADEDSGTETDDETGGPDEGKASFFMHIYLHRKYDDHYQSRKWMMITHVKCTILLIFCCTKAGCFRNQTSHFDPAAAGSFLNSQKK